MTIWLWYITKQIFNTAYLHSLAGADNKYDEGVTKHSHKGDGSIEYRQQYDDSSLQI